MLPMAAAVAFSRVYNGVHYPSDVLAGAILGAGYGAALVIGAQAVWNLAGRKWFPAAIACRASRSVTRSAPPLSATSEARPSWNHTGMVMV